MSRSRMIEHERLILLRVNNIVLDINVNYKCYSTVYNTKILIRNFLSISGNSLLTPTPSTMVCG